MPSNRQNPAASDSPSALPRRRISWAWLAVQYAVVLTAVIYFLHEDLPTTILGIVIFTAAWAAGVYVDYRWPPKLRKA